MTKKLLLATALLFSVSSAHAFEIFAKGSVSKSYLRTSDEWVLSSSGAGGIAFALFPWLRLEGRYTSAASQQSFIESEGYTLTDIRTIASMYSVTMEISFGNERSSFAPYFAIGGGYIKRTRTFNVVVGETTTAAPADSREGLSLNGGAGVRVRVAKNLALELELVGYAAGPANSSFDLRTSLIDWDAKVGLRLFL